jgi:hypothetical protein
VGAPDWFKQGALALPYGISILPLGYAPAVSAASELQMVQQDKADGPDLVRCWLQKDPARQLPNLKMPILVLTGEASSRALRPLHRQISRTGGRQADLHQARGPRRSRQQPCPDAGEEQQGKRRRDRAMAR